MKTKRLLCSVLAAIMLIACVPAMAAGDITVIVDGQEVVFDVAPQVVDGRTMVPLRAIFEALGADVRWYQDIQTVVSSNDDVTVQLAIGSDTMYVNGDPVILDVQAYTVDGRTFVPVRAISEAYKADVEWDASTNTVIITSLTDPNSTAVPGSNFEALKNMIISEGDYSAENDMYYIYQELDAETDVMITYGVEDGNISMGYFSYKNYSELVVVVHLFADSTNGVSMSTSNVLGEYDLFCEFDSSGQLSVFAGNMPYEVQPSALHLIRTTFVLFDLILMENGSGVTLSDFGIAY